MWVNKMLSGPEKVPTAFPLFDDYSKCYEYYRIDYGVELVMESIHQKGMYRGVGSCITKITHDALVQR